MRKLKKNYSIWLWKILPVRYVKEIEVESDRKPLESIFKSSLHQAPMRLQSMLLRLQKYSLRVTYKPGKQLHIADALSCAYLRETEEELLVNCITHQLPMTEEKQERFKRMTAIRKNHCSYIHCQNDPGRRLAPISFITMGQNFSLCRLFSRNLQVDWNNNSSHKSVFASHGIPDIVISDNFPQYASAEFRVFAENWEFQHLMSSPNYPQSNGQAKRTVQAIKNLLKKS